MSISKIKIWTITGITAALIVIGLSFREHLAERPPGSGHGGGTGTQIFEIAHKTALPDILEEVSGIEWIRDGVIACVQDEDGIIFMVDLKRGKIIKEIRFGGKGDYEGLSISGNDAFVLRSDGMLFQIGDYALDKPQIQSYKLPFSESHNMETLAFDEAQDRLLLAPKDHDPNSESSKGIYAFSLLSMKMEPKAIYNIDLGADSLRTFRQKDIFKTFRPSDMAVHPQTGELYVLEGTYPKLLILDRTGKLHGVQVFDEALFPQPEGITFAPDGTLFISNEGRKQQANILELRKR